MGYRALYRVWRPQRFDELIGQHVITQTLKNALITGQISHAYLFAGPRGTGKTSAAKILAKAVNCPNLKDGEPCNQCDICEAITNGTLNDVIEIDAASNNGVDEIRDVRDKAKYAPTQSKYKIYIIDEVHMLSIGAFNALLKTLEEPPTNVIFIMATTEPHKIPATIISRTQRFDFKRIKPREILDQMEFILGKEKIEYDDQALKVIAKSAEGGMRDALSVLDQSLSYGRDKITYENALQVTGSTSKELIYKYLIQILNHDVKNALLSVQRILDEGKDANQFIEDLINYGQDILLDQQSSQMVEEVDLGVIDDHLEELADKMSQQFIYDMIEQLNSIQEQMRFTMHPDVYLEILTVKLSNIDSSKNDSKQLDNQKINSLTQQVEQLQSQVKELSSRSLANPSDNNQMKEAKPTENNSDQSSNTPPQHNPSIHLNLKTIYPILDNATRGDLNQMKDAFAEFVDSLPVTQKAMMKLSKPVAASNSGVVLSFAYDFFYQQASNDPKLIDTITNGLDRILGNSPRIAFVPDEKWPDIRREYYNSRKKTENKSSDSKKNLNDSDESVESNEKNNYSKDNNGDSNGDSDESDFVNKASELFGKDILEVKND